MGFSLAKTFWKTWLWLFDVFTKLFFILSLAVFVLIIIQIEPDFKDFITSFLSLITIFTIANFARIFPLWIQAIYLWLYVKFSHWLILKLLAPGMVDYNFTWTLPKWINDILGVSVSGTFADFIFWSGLVLIALMLIDRLERELLIFLAQKMKIGWAEELIKERVEKISKAQKKEEGIIEAGKKEEAKVGKISLPLPSKERVIFRPKFFKDRLWYQWFFFLSMVLPFLILFFLLGYNNEPGALNAMNEESSNSLYFIWGVVLSIFLICLPFFLREVTTRIILEKDKIVIKTFFFRKTEIYYSDIKNIDVKRNGVLEIYYDKQTKKGKIPKIVGFFPWAFTMEKLLRELAPRLENINIDENFILNSMKEVKAARNPATTVLIMLITVGLSIGFIYYIIHQATNRTKLSDEDCAQQLEFWINDEPKTGILETKAGFNPEISIKAPFYFFVDAENAPGCDKNISFIIYNASGNIVSQKGGLIPSETGETGIVNYYWEAVFKEKGNYLLKVNYGNIPAKEINFSVK